ncbi:hypothetical protein JCM10213_000757 [Rhodosporidiobolus nylandii]
MTQIWPTSSPVPPPARDTKEERLATATDLATEVFELPTVSGARFLPGDAAQEGFSVLHLTTSSRSLTALSKRSATQSLILCDADASVLAASPAVFASEEVRHVAIRPDGQKQAVFRVLAPKDGQEQRKLIEIVDVKSGRKDGEIEVSKEHGEWYFDGTFGPPAWHPSSHALVYTAEAPPHKPDPKETRPGQAKFRYEPDFGETFTGKREPTLFLLVLPTSPLASRLAAQDKPTVHRLTFSRTLDSTYFGQPVFLPTSSPEQVVLAATGYSSLADKRKLGIVYCQNRPARIFALSLRVEQVEEDAAEKGEPKKVFRVGTVNPVSAADRSSRSPRVVPGSSGDTVQLAYISNPLGGPHASCGQLHLSTVYLPLSSSSSAPAELQVRVDKVLVPVVDVPDPKNPGAGTADDPFPGLYVDQLPLEPFLAKGPAATAGKVRSLAPWPESRKEVDAALPYLYLAKEAGREDPLASVSVLGTDGKDRVVALRSSPIRPAELVVARVEEGAAPRWTVVRESGISENLSTTLSSWTYTVFPLPKFEPTELILVSPNSIDPTAPSTPNLPPLINQPHGGPHSTVCTEFNWQVASMLLAGYRFCHVNYPGSLGFGQAAVDVLPPHLGDLEVEATLAAPHYLNQLSLASRTPGKRLLMGGSHGGWTAAHLTARWPDEFDAVVMRNPVTDLLGNAGQTDIPDWCYAEGTLPYPFSSPPSYLTPETFTKMHSISPLRHAHQVKTPTLLLIGAADRRVPPDQGRAWYHALKKEGTEVEMLSFPGNGHPIDSTVEAQWVAWESGLKWLASFTDFS